MPVLYVLSGRDVGKSFRVDDRAEIGRHPSCAVPIGDTSVSRHHARIERTAGGWDVVDLGSRNGVVVAGSRCERWTLSDGDEFKLGEVSLRFRLAPAREGASLESAPVASEPDSPATRASAASETATREPALEFEDEIELESLVPTTVRPRAPLAPAASAPPVAPVAPGASLRPAAPVPPARAPTAVNAEPLPADARAELLARMRHEERGNLATGDMAQMPAGMRALVVVLAVVLAAGLFWAAYQGVLWLRTRG
jgi:predicted component of type VI protein secretion system